MDIDRQISSSRVTTINAFDSAPLKQSCPGSLRLPAPHVKH